LRALTGRRLRQRVQQPEPREVRKPRMLTGQHMAECVGALVAEVLRVRQLTDAEGVADEEDGAFHGHERAFLRRGRFPTAVAADRLATLAMPRSARLTDSSSGKSSTRSRSIRRTHCRSTTPSQ